MFAVFRFFGVKGTKPGMHGRLPGAVLGETFFLTRKAKMNCYFAMGGKKMFGSLWVISVLPECAFF